MRVNVNLATQKFEEVRLFIWRATLAIGVAGAMLLVLIVFALFNYNSNSKAGAKIRAQEKEIAELQQERAAAEAVENRAENRDVTLQKNFWNRQIATRALSWTQLFNELQRIMPKRAYLASVAPELTPDNKLKLKITIRGEKHEDALELQKRMETSERFSRPEIKEEQPQKEKTGSVLWTFQIETMYVPSAPMSMHAGAREGLQ
jgi:type IV pilus assembly protein PilN